jgi:hypothetical protein
MRKNISGQVVTAQLINSSDGSDVVTGTTTVYVTIDGGTQSAGAGTVAHEGNGTWSYAPTQAETNGNHVVFTFTHTSAITAAIQVYTVSFDPHDTADLGLTNLDAAISTRSTFDATSDAVANVTLVATTTNVTNDVGITQVGADKVWGTTTRAITDKAGFTISGTKTTLDALNDIAATDIVSAGAINTLAGAVVNVDLVDTCTTNTDMRGTDNALLASGYTAPDNSSITAILADTNELQLNQGDWATATGFATVNPDNASITAILEDTGTTIPAQIAALNDFDPATDAVATVTNLTNLPSIPTNWITASGIAANALDNKGNWNVGKTGYSLTQTFPTNFSSMAIDVSGNVNSFTQGFLSTTLTETTAGRIAGNFDVFFENADAVTTKVVDDVGTAISGGGEFTATEKNQIRYRLGMDGTTAVPTATPDLSQKSDITDLNDFNPATDTVAHVTLVDTTTTNTDMRGTDSAYTGTPPTVSQIVDGVWDEAQSGHTTAGTFGFYLDSEVSAAGGGGGTTPADIWSYATRSLTDKAGFSISGTKTTLDDLNDFNAASDVVANVTLVDTTTTNTDMRGTDNALLASSYTAPDNSSITDILADTNELQLNQGNWLTATGFATVNPDNASIAAILEDTSTTIPNQISALNDISVSDVWTTQLVESYAADGVAPTATQAILMTQQFLTDFDITGVSYNVKRLDGATAAGTFTINDSANPTSITRSS